MIRLGISVEGPTERTFVNTVLAPHLARFDVLATAVDMRGNVSLDRIRSELRPLLGGFDHVTTLYDYYGFKRRGASNVDELQAEIANLVGPQQQRRLTPYVQLHEFEALLFAAPDITVQALGGAEREVSTLSAAVRECGSPEAVNDSPETSPSHRIKALFKHFDKPLHGPRIVLAAGLDAIRAQCPRFDGWITQLESLAEARA